MDSNNAVLKIQLITLFDSVNFGLIYAFINPHLLATGGDNLAVGIFAVLYLICQLLSNDITRILTHTSSKQHSLYLLSTFAVLSYLLIILTNNCWVIICARCIFGLTNQTNEILRSLLATSVPKEESEHFLFLHNILSLVGYIVGPIISGCLYSSGFFYSCLLAVGLTFLNIGLILSIPEDKDESPATSIEQPVLDKTVQRVINVLSDFLKSDYEKNWDLLALKYFFTAFVSIFYSKFTQLLKYNFDADAVVIGYTLSYMNGLGFVATYIVSHFKGEYESLSFIKVAYQTLVISLIFACFSPIYFIYVLMCIPITIAKCYIHSNWVGLFSSRKNALLNQMNDNAGIIAGLTVPIVFGITCDNIGHYAVILFSIVPIIASLYVLNKYTNQYQKLTENDNKAKEE